VRRSREPSADTLESFLQKLARAALFILFGCGGIVCNMPPGCTRFLRRVTCALVAGVGVFACGGEAERSPRPLNLILIVVDTLRADHLGYHGYSQATSPRLDSLAEDSVVFLRHTGHASRTGPSVATLFTGLHSRSHGVVNPLSHFDAKGSLDASHLTLAEILSEDGYRCAGFTANSNVSERFGFSQGFERFQLLRWENAEALNRAALGWIEGWTAEAEPRSPFCLYLHYVDPHSPYEAPAPFVKKFAPPDYRGRITGSHQQLDEVVAGRLEPDDADLLQLRALYDAEIGYLDSQLGVLLITLEAKGLLDESLVVFVADHGEELLDHDSVLHGYTLYEEQLRIPLMIRHPELPARRVSRLSRQVDVLPTVLELLGIALPESVQGESLVTAMNAEPGTDLGDEAPVFAEASLRAVKTVALDSYARGDWKLIETRFPEPRKQLFNLRDDPQERHDRLASEPEVAERMSTELRRFRDALPVGHSEAVPLSDAEIRELRSLGYLPEE
jgi:arylsulfatase A-like enzyme